MSESRKRSFVVRLGPRYAEIVRAEASRNACSNGEAAERMIGIAADVADVFRGDTLGREVFRLEVTKLKAEIERLKKATTRAVESSDAIDAVQEYAREKSIPENEAAERLIEIGWRRHRALEKSKGRTPA
jgi:uncharacterized small protein (DUF1192 family)